MELVLLISAVAGAVGGLTRLLISGKGRIPLPRVYDLPGHSRHLNLGFLLPVVLGMIAGALVNKALHIDGMVSFMAGYAGSDFIENAIERRLKIGEAKETRERGPR